MALLGLGVLAGSVAGTGNVSAQSPAQSPSQTPAATPSAPGTNPASPGNPPGGPPYGRDMRGHGPGDVGGRGIGPGGGATAAGASAQITDTTNLINLVKTDLAYANGKMDTTDAQRWINEAGAQLNSAQSANGSSQYGQAAEYARAARELAEAADTQMAQKLGADKLPSYSQRPQMPGKAAPTGVTVTQAQASRILAEAYDRLVMEGAIVKGASNAGKATAYLTDAQNAYKTAYVDYQASKYSDALADTRLAGELTDAADAVTHAATAPANSDTPVTVPAPNF
jgi:hypothetical protein